LRLIEIRNPQDDDLVGRRILVAGFGTAFGAAMLWRLLDAAGEEIDGGVLPGGGANGVEDSFAYEMFLREADFRGARVVLQVYGDDPSGRCVPGADLNEIRLILFTGLTGWKVWKARSEETLSDIARDHGLRTTPADMVAANPGTRHSPTGR